MVISRLQIDKIEKNISLIQEFLSHLKNLSEIPEKEFLSSTTNSDAAAESYLRRSLEVIFDTGRYILSKIYGFKDIEYKKIALELGKKKIVSINYSETLIKMAGYRNRMVHLYYEVSPKEIYDILKYHLTDIEQFIEEIANFIKKYQQNI
jgi:uncharacterized protein YutE (UPF0331/DUF86 family)